MDTGHRKKPEDGMKRAVFGRIQTWLTMIIMACSASAVATDFSTWSHGMKITFTGYTRPETLTNFPALVVFTNGLGGGFNYGDFQSLTKQDLRVRSCADPPAGRG